MKKEFLDQTEHLLAASIPTIIFMTIFVYIVWWATFRKNDDTSSIAKLPLE
jgi:cbb3-type cytochrome oxidase subunit 3